MTEIIGKPKIFKRNGKWQLCHTLPANKFNIPLTAVANSYCDRMNRLSDERQNKSYIDFDLLTFNVWHPNYLVNA